MDGPFAYPTEVEVDHERRTVNLAWFSKQYKDGMWGQQVNKEFFDFELATYLVANHLPRLVQAHREKLPLLLQNPYEHNDNEILEFLKAMRDDYLRVVPTKPTAGEKGSRGWRNQLLNYLRNLLTSSSNAGVSSLLLMKLIGLSLVNITVDDASRLMGGGVILFQINNAFANVKEAGYNLVLPEDLHPLYHGNGFDYVQWSDAIAQYLGNFEDVGPESQELV